LTRTISNSSTRKRRQTATRATSTSSCIPQARITHRGASRIQARLRKARGPASLITKTRTRAVLAALNPGRRARVMARVQRQAPATTATSKTKMRTTISMTILKRRPEPMIWMTMESLGTPLRKARRASPERRRIQEDHLPRAARLPVAQRASQVQAAASRPVRRRSKRVHIRAEGSSARSHYPPRAASSRPWRRISPR